MGVSVLKGRKIQRRLIFSVFAVVLVLLFGTVAIAATVYVPDNYSTIQQAVNNTQSYDTIVVRDGVYYENVVVEKPLTIKSENGSTNCIVDGEGKGDVFTLHASENPD